ncbi:MAG: hypothetical protein COA78_03600 [Blastopirellula sp.]|nr:MAG: hypothetical protein COA78_03600 [Blastopirellula sp.]
MKRLFLLFAIGIASLTMNQSAKADWEQFWNSVRVDYVRNKCWPAPFNYQDRAATNSHLNLMVQNGIRLQNTLGRFHFDSVTHQINHAGEMKARQILRNTPDRRSVFVLEGLTTSVTEARMQSTKDALARIVGDERSLEVYPTSREPSGRSADYINDIYNAERQSIPAPRLPAASSDSGS